MISLQVFYEGYVQGVGFRFTVRHIAKGFDADRGFALFEIAGDELYFQALSRTGEIVDSGMIQKAAATTAP